ncbi:TetR/AcrR family transcriptional regulator [Knoellia sp. S7-12]|uniref:TetR/AcrR family transcriptional regulator n=1 Tax=Knoellia sp. S7-12 TaxID=3126698 RepID=UPI0033671563
MHITPTAGGVRPRVAGDREGEILEGVLDVLEDVGYDKLTFDLVAAQVKASKATLYRRWPTKADLVMGAIALVKLCPGEGDVPPDTGTLRGDMHALACTDGELTSRLPDLMSAVIPALHRDTELTERFKESFVAPRQKMVGDILHRAQQRGEIAASADLELLAAIIPALAMHHTFVRGQGPTEAYMRGVIDDVLIPACQATTTT